MRPNQEEMRRAFQAGFRSIDDGDTFYDGFYECLGSLGYRRPDDVACTCPDGGAHGHMPECGWVKS